MEPSLFSSVFTRVIQLLEEIGDPFGENGDLRGHGIPDDFEIDPEVIVNQPVAHSGDSTPLDLGISLPDGLRDLLDRFPDNLEAADERPLEGFISQKRLPDQAV